MDLEGPFVWQGFPRISLPGSISGSIGGYMKVQDGSLVTKISKMLKRPRKYIMQRIYSYNAKERELFGPIYVLKIQ